MANRSPGGHGFSAPRESLWQTVDWRRHVSNTDLGELTLRHTDVGAGPALLLVHGLGGNWQFWLENIWTLSRGHRVIAVDLPGFGHSDCVPGQVSMAAFADVLAQLLAKLEITGVTVVGHSMGGLVAQRFAVAYPHFVDRLVLVGSGGLRLPFWRRTGLLAAALTINALVRLRFVKRALAQSRAVRRLALSKIVYDPVCVSAPLFDQLAGGFGSPGFVRAITAAVKEDFEKDLSSIDCPTLLLYGDADPLATPKYAATLAKSIPHSQLVTWERIGHAPMIERPDAFNQLIIDFVANHLSQSPSA